VVMAIVNNIPVAFNYCLHAQIVAESSSYVNSTYWSGLPTPRPKRNGPHIPTPGRAAVLRAGSISSFVASCGIVAKQLSLAINTRCGCGTTSGTVEHLEFSHERPGIDLLRYFRNHDLGR
jgi:hypothetical protein